MAFATGGTERVTSWPLLIQTSPLVVEPGKTLLVMGTLPIGSITPPYPEPTTTCAMEIFFTGSDNETKAHRVWFECIFAVPALNAARQIAKQQNAK
jgi:hypothetical protein